MSDFDDGTRYGHCLFADATPVRSSAPRAMEWPDFGVPEVVRLDCPISVQLVSVIMRPLDRYSALATLRLRLQLSPAGEGNLNIAVAPLRPSVVQVRMLRTHAHHEQCEAAGCEIIVPFTASEYAEIPIELRLDGENVGIVPPELHVRVTAARIEQSAMDETTTIRRVTPVLGIGGAGYSS